MTDAREIPDLGEVHRFSAWRALGAVILGVLLIALPLLGVLFLVVP
jgi:hypothetical protein